MFVQLIYLIYLDCTSNKIPSVDLSVLVSHTVIQRKIICDHLCKDWIGTINIYF